ncbi:hypothetical protein Bca52824_058506 [Brassica carinata]|uniref:Uncharacterized protein n=1 Tax=Brassica carinata TaxID=52824 RepID=A0A8X7QTM7_BRACI|nr:hypothetical protein Bca52824_058506 [Brassica carinata]
MRVSRDQGPTRKQDREKTCVLWPTGVVPSLHAYRGQDIASLFPSSSLVWAVFEPGEGSAFLSVPRNSSFDSPAYVTYQRCEPGRKMWCAASEPFIFLLWGRVMSLDALVVSGACQIDASGLSTDFDVCDDCPWNVEAGSEVETWSRGEPNVIEGRFQAGTESRQGPETVEVVDEPGGLALRILPYGYGPVYVVVVLVAAGEVDL